MSGAEPAESRKKKRRGFEARPGFHVVGHRLALDPGASALQALASHCGAARVAYNWAVRHVLASWSQPQRRRATASPRQSAFRGGRGRCRRCGRRSTRPNTPTPSCGSGGRRTRRRPTTPAWRTLPPRSTTTPSPGAASARAPGWAGPVSSRSGRLLWRAGSPGPGRTCTDPHALPGRHGARAARDRARCLSPPCLGVPRAAAVSPSWRSVAGHARRMVACISQTRISASWSAVTRCPPVAVRRTASPAASEPSSSRVTLPAATNRCRKGA